MGESCSRRFQGNCTRIDPGHLTDVTDQLYRQFTGKEPPLPVVPACAGGVDPAAFAQLQPVLHLGHEQGCGGGHAAPEHTPVEALPLIEPQILHGKVDLLRLCLLTPQGQRGVVMSPGIAHAVLYAVVGEIGAVRCGGKGKFQNPHPRQTGIRQQLHHVGRRLTQILCDEADALEPAGEDVQQIQPRPLDPAAGFGGRRTVGHRPIAGEAPEMVNADHVIQSGGAVHPANPPAEAVPLHGVIIVERIAPKLAVLGEVVRRNTGHLCGNAPAVQTEHGSFRPDVSGVHGHINRQVADDTDAKAVDIGLQGGPLAEEQKLDIGEQFHILPQQLPVPGQSRRSAEPDSLIGPF